MSVIRPLLPPVIRSVMKQRRARDGKRRQASKSSATGLVHLLKQKETPQTGLFHPYVNPEALVPENHLLRRIHESVDLFFLIGEAKGLYSPNGRRELQYPAPS